MERFITAESVTIGHPDKLCDIIADAILTECMRQDPESRVACEVMLTAGFCVIAGEITTTAKVDYKEIAKHEISAVGYDPSSVVFVAMIHEQSPDIAQAVDGAGEQGAGDQGIVYGYATDETAERLPLPFVFARALTKEITEHARKSPETFGPDGKAQVTLNYKHTTPKLWTVVVSAQHRKAANGADYMDIVHEIERYTENAVYGVAGYYDIDTIDLVQLTNPSGEFVKGGFEADTGLTGRKLMVDTYGGIAHHGGGAFSGKDPSKLDRSGAYMARYIANHIVDAKLAKRCEVSLAYAIGQADPVAINIETFGTSVYSEKALTKAVNDIFDCTPRGIIDELGLKHVDYKRTAIEGHFGGDFPWERTPYAKELATLAFEYDKD